ncbi:MAG: hypothetical protein L0220_04815 [Acidobacteria bacterium]|nr:hypothetical protein [Acidobacteriota bacterium]
MRNYKIRMLISIVLMIAVSCLGMFNTSVALADKGPKAANAKPDVDPKAGIPKPDVEPRSVINKYETQIVGQLTVIGAATVNDKRAITGTSVFNNSRIKVACAKGNSAIVNLGRLGRVELTPGTQLLLRFSEGLVSGDLIEGNIVVNAPVGVKVSINSQTGIVASDGKEAAVLPVKTQRGVRCVPLSLSGSSSASALGPGALAALVAGVGGLAVVGAVVAGSNASNVVP